MLVELHLEFMRAEQRLKECDRRGQSRMYGQHLAAEQIHGAVKQQKHVIAVHVESGGY